MNYPQNRFAPADDDLEASSGLAYAYETAQLTLNAPASSFLAGHFTSSGLTPEAGILCFSAGNVETVACFAYRAL